MCTGCIGWVPFEALSRLYLGLLSADVMGLERLLAKARDLDPEKPKHTRMHLARLSRRIHHLANASFMGASLPPVDQKISGSGVCPDKS